MKIKNYLKTRIRNPALMLFMMIASIAINLYLILIMPIVLICGFIMPWKRVMEIQIYFTNKIPGIK